MIIDTSNSDAAIWLIITLACYIAAVFLYRKSAASPVMHPLVLSAAVIFILLQLVDVAVDDYQQYVALLDWLLGPAIVALALPLFRQISVIRGLGLRILIPILCGGILAPLLAWSTMFWLTDDSALQITMLVKSITTPLAIEVSYLTQGIPALAAGVVITTGIVGAMASNLVFKVMNIRSEAAQGISLGTIAHAIGTAKALQMTETTAALATLSLCINGITTALIVPILF